MIIKIILMMNYIFILCNFLVKGNVIEFLYYI